MIATMHAAISTPPVLPKPPGAAAGHLDPTSLCPSCHSRKTRSCFSPPIKGGDNGGEDTATSAGGDVLSILEGEEVGGVVFSTVAARRPELKRELGILRQALLLEEQAGGSGDGGDGGGSEELKVQQPDGCFT